MYLDKPFSLFSTRIKLSIGPVSREAVIHTIADISAISQREEAQLRRDIETRGHEIQQMLLVLKSEGKIEVKVSATEAPKPLTPPRAPDFDTASINELGTYTDDLYAHHYSVLERTNTTLNDLNKQFSKLEGEIEAKYPEAMTGLRPR